MSPRDKFVTINNLCSISKFAYLPVTKINFFVTLKPDLYSRRDAIVHFCVARHIADTSLVGVYSLSHDATIQSTLDLMILQGGVTKSN